MSVEENGAGPTIWSSGTDGRGVAARICLDAAREVGLRCTDVRWVRLGERAVLSLDAGRVVARIERPGVSVEDAAHEIAVARWLACCGVPVAHPLPVEQPVVAYGFVVTFWFGVSGTPGNAAQLAGILRCMHELVPPPEIMRPSRPFVRLRERIDRAQELEPDARTALLGALATTMGRWDDVASRLTPGFVHGDTTSENVLSTVRGPVALDLEYAGWGHREWDLAQTASRYDSGLLSDAEYALFCRIYGHDVRTSDCYPLLRRARRLRELTGLVQSITDSSGAGPHEELRRRIADLDGAPTNDCDSSPNRCSGGHHR